MFKADDYRLRLKSLSETLAEAKYALDIDNLDGKLDELKAEQEKPEAVSYTHLTLPTILRV